MITLIVARDRNGAIGRDGTIPWDIPEDLKAFQRETLGGALIMGRNTWNSLPVKPLARRLNIVVSSRPDAADTVVGTVHEAIQLALEKGYHRIYGIGGAGIYRDMLPLANRLLITEVDLCVDGADTFFPEVDLEDWWFDDERPLNNTGPRCVVREFLPR